MKYDSQVTVEGGVKVGMLTVAFEASHEVFQLLSMLRDTGVVSTADCIQIYGYCEKYLKLSLLPELTLHTENGKLTCYSVGCEPVDNPCIEQQTYLFTQN